MAAYPSLFFRYPHSQWGHIFKTILTFDIKRVIILVSLICIALKGECFTKGIVHTNIVSPIYCIYQAE